MKEINSTLRVFFSVIGLNIGWFSCVLSASWNMDWLSILVVTILVASHLFIIGKQRVPSAVQLILVSLFFGFVLDTALILGRIYVPTRWVLPSPITTIWLLMLWINFSLTLNESLKWLQDHLFTGAILGSILGPLAYFAASRFGAVQITNPVFSKLIWVGFAWFIAMPLMSLVAKSLYAHPYRFLNK
jgi:hypothetical protein